MKKDDIKLPPLHYDELPEPDDPIPAMHNYARRAIKADRQLRGEPVTGGNVSELLSAIQLFGSRKRQEGAGLSDPKLQAVRSAWDEVYRLVQAVAAPKFGEE